MTWQDTLTDGDLDAVDRLLGAVGVTDGFRGGSHALAYDDGVVGYLHVDTKGDAHGRPVAELLVHPEHRRRGVGTALTESLLDRVPDRPLRIWSHGDHPGAVRLAEKFGFARVRELLKMGLDLRDCPQLPVPSWPAGVRLRTFVPGQDEADVVAVNSRAFDWHPEQGALTVADVAAAEDESWFDPDGFFLAIDPEDRLLGFHWTKVHNLSTEGVRQAGHSTEGVRQAGHSTEGVRQAGHSTEGVRQAGHLTPPVGEVYVVGVDPEAQGGGLGKALTLAGLHHLHRGGLSQVILYVEADNKAALAVYEHLGFGTVATDVQYELVSA